MLNVFRLLLLTTLLLAGKEVNLECRSITFEGNTVVETASLEEAAGVQRPGKLTFWKDQTPRIKCALIPTIPEALRSLYHSEGFYDATFNIAEDDRSVKITVKEGKPVRVSEVEIESDYNISAFIPFVTKQRFKTATFIQSKSDVIKALLDEGYCSYDLDTKAYIDVEKYTVELVYKLSKGKTCKFGKTTIEGLDRVNSKVVEARVDAVEGSRYSAESISNTYKNLYMLDVFESVLVNYDKKFYNVVPVEIILKETTTPYHLEAGVGYDTYVGPRVSATLVRKNFLGNAQKLTLKGAWSQEEQLVEMGFFRPVFFRLLGYDADFGASLGYSNLKYEGFREEKEYIGGYLEHLFRKWRVRAGTNLEYIVIDAKGGSAVTTTVTYQVNEGNFILFYPYLDLVYDGRDSRLDPKYGFYFSNYFEYGLSAEDGSSGYTKLEIEGRLIHTFSDLTLAMVGKAGAIDVETGGLPESKYFFGGGSYSNRAYGYRQLGVILSTKQNSVYGAASMANLSFEADYPVWGDLYGAVFNDNTMLGEKVYDFSAGTISSVGVGVRYMTPIGPFKLDVGWNIKKTSDYAIAFQIGQSF